MAFENRAHRLARQALNSKQWGKGIRMGSPTLKDLTEGLSEIRYVPSQGLVQYIKYNNVMYSSNFEPVGSSNPMPELQDELPMVTESIEDPTEWIYENRTANFYEDGAVMSYVPLSSQSIVEYNAVQSGGTPYNEYLWFITPFEGYVEKISFRSTVAQDGTLKFEIVKCADGDDLASATPAVLGDFRDTIDIADDIIHTMNIEGKTPNSGNNYIPINTMIAIRMTTPSNPYNCNVTVLFRWKK